MTDNYNGSYAELVTDIAENVELVFEAGQKSEYDRFWDAFQENGNRTSYQQAFIRWKQEIFNPKHSFILVGNGASQMFQYAYITDIITPFKKRNLVLDTSEVTHFTQMFQGAKVEHIPTLDLRKAVNTSYMFGSGCAVVTIDKLIVSETTPLNYSVFDGENLENITFEGVIGSDVSFSYCKKLTHESLMSIKRALKSGVSGLTVTFSTKHKEDGKLTDSDIAEISAKGWSVAFK